MADGRMFERRFRELCERYDVTGVAVILIPEGDPDTHANRPVDVKLIGNNEPLLKLFAKTGYPPFREALLTVPPTIRPMPPTDDNNQPTED